jgi:hypothetical protein
MLSATLEKAFAEASKLNEEEQNALAAWILQEIDSQKRWEKAFSSSADKLAQLAAEALEEHRRGETHELDPEEL